VYSLSATNPATTPLACSCPLPLTEQERVREMPPAKPSAFTDHIDS
jgi:hypothetical protein